MLRRAGTIKEDCNSFAQEVDMLQTRVQSVTNQFLNLANDQFVENCVEEFEERDAIKQASPSPLVHQVRTKAEKEAELIKKMKESIQVGIKSNSLCDQLRYCIQLFNPCPNYNGQFTTNVGYDLTVF